MRQSLSILKDSPQAQKWAMAYVVTPHPRAERTVSSETWTGRRSSVVLKSDIAGHIDQMIANIDPLPSANQNLMFARGVFNSLISYVREEALPATRYFSKIATKIWPRLIERKFNRMSVPASISLLALFEGVILWSLALLAGAVPGLPPRAVETVVAAL